jgi:hypothetical protein
MENLMVKDDAIERVLSLMEQLEKAKQPAIESLLAQKADIEAKLEQLGYNGGSAPEPRKRAPKTCKLCPSGSPESKTHTARTHDKVMGKK